MTRWKVGSRFAWIMNNKQRRRNLNVSVCGMQTHSTCQTLHSIVRTRTFTTKPAPMKIEIRCVYIRVCALNFISHNRCTLACQHEERMWTRELHIWRFSRDAFEFSKLVGPPIYNYIQIFQPYIVGRGELTQFMHAHIYRGWVLLRWPLWYGWKTGGCLYLCLLFCRVPSMFAFDDDGIIIMTTKRFRLGENSRNLWSGDFC